jgi:ATP-dependent phosphoenolpyruvate carboxykinase
MDLINLILSTKKIYYNLSYDLIYQHEISQNEIILSDSQSVCIFTGKYTGRSPKDKYIVKQSPSDKDIWWGPVSHPMDVKTFEKLENLVYKDFELLESLYVFDGYCGASPNSRIKVRFISGNVIHHHFVKNMFIGCDAHFDTFEPDFTLEISPQTINPDWKTDGCNSEIFVAFNLEKKLGLIGGTEYTGEIKKGIFTLMNYLLPKQNILSAHCSATIGSDNNQTTLFFGLSGTGKTTLSADPLRSLIGDDEHGWDSSGIFNLEGGCYAKTIGLDPNAEPQIYSAIRPNALVENIYINPQTSKPDYFNISITENGRVSYPISHISNSKSDGLGSHPSNIIFLAADAFGVLPLVAKLSLGQAMYYYLSGYTSKIAGTERGVKEPQATFSACFGEPFLVFHPTKYADLLLEKLQTHKSQVYLVNTGWTGTGQRISISTTRYWVDAILSGQINSFKYKIDENFGFEIPETLESDQKSTWKCPLEYDLAAKKLVQMFKQNYLKYQIDGYTDYSIYGPN